MRRIVDASALVDALLPSMLQDAALSAMVGYELWAPPILDLEVSSALWRLVRTEQITTPEADHAVTALNTSPIRRLTHQGLASEAWRLREALRISDAFYVAAARMLDADLLTSDGRLARAPRLGVTVVLLG